MRDRAIVWILSGNRVDDERRVGDGPRHYARMVDERRMPQHSGAWQDAEARLETDDSAIRGWPDDRAIRLCAERDGRKLRRDRRRRSARRSARRMRGVVRILGRPRDEERILRRDGLADDDCARGAQPVHDDSVPLRPPSSEYFCAEFGRHVRGVDDVLDSDGQAMKRPWRYASRPRLVDAFGRRKRGVRIEIGEGAQLRFKSGDAIEKRAHRLDGGEFAPTHAVDQRTRGHVQQSGHSIYALCDEATTRAGARTAAGSTQ